MLHQTVCIGSFPIHVARLEDPMCQVGARRTSVCEICYFFVLAVVNHSEADSEDWDYWEQNFLH